MVVEHSYPLQHLAIIMDGNNRWAKERGLDGIIGHEQGVERIRTVLDALQHHEIKILTVFAFSSENWNRPKLEVRALMSLFASYLKKESYRLAEAGVQIKVIGSREKFSPRLQKLITNAENITREGTRVLVLAVDYGGRWDITQAAKNLAKQVKKGELNPDDINEKTVEEQLCLSHFPMPDLCIRTAGERRISNFMLWQLAYSEFYFADCYWPDFDVSELDKAIDDYYTRQRRFGKRSAQTDCEGITGA